MNKNVFGIPVVLVFFVLVILVPLLLADASIFQEVKTLRVQQMPTPQVVVAPTMAPTATPSATLVPTKSFFKAPVVTRGVVK